MGGLSPGLIDLRGKTAIVTGSGRGVWRTITVRLAGERIGVVNAKKGVKNVRVTV